MSPSVDISSLNERQLQIATTLDEPLFVEAGAGSGKTFTLTRRVAWALSPGSGEGGAPFLDGLDQVLVITFTEAAAREIKERVRSTLRRAGMRGQVLAVDDAWISTIHGMCSRILHRHALDLGLDPSFSVAGTSEEAALLDAALEGVMREAREGHGFDALLDAYRLGTYSPQGGYTGALGIVHRLVRAGRSLPGGVDALVAARPAPGGVGELMADLLARFEELGACRGLSAKAADAVAQSLSALRAFEGLAPGERTVESASAALEAVRLPARSNAVAEALPAAKAALALARCETAFQAAAPLADEALELARRVEARYAEAKRAASCLDNDDLIRLALAAVRDNDEVRRDYEGRFRLVMVDEFQDTDSAQLELIGLLAGDGGRHLCTVGDAQQSIYRFRGADVGVFRGRGAEVGESGTVRLDTNYRSHADVLALVERVCTGGGTGARGAMPRFMHLDHCPTRDDAYRARDLPRIDVEVVGGPGRSGRATAEQRAAMADGVADALARYRDAGERPGDMALLLGVTTHADLYIDAIRARGMECVVTGGSTFTSTDEVKVVCALLHALANPADTRSGLFPLLASEMFGLDANDFCALGTRAQEKLDAPTKRPIDQGLRDMAFYGGIEPSARLARAHEVLGRALDELRWRPVADVCADVARDSGWLARLEAQGAEGLARAANVLAAIRYVRDLTERMGLGAARAATEFDLWLAASKIPPASLAGAREDGSGGTVRVMTIHASKGLEFPVCAVAECWGARPGDSSIALGPTADGGSAFVLRPPAPSRDLDSWLGALDPEDLEASSNKGAPLPLSARYQVLRQADREGDAEESARLLYVALTRAREALVLCVNAASGKGGVSSELASAALDALGIDPTCPGELAVDFGGSAPARVRRVVVGEGAGDGNKGAASPDGPAEGAAADDSGPSSFDLYELEPPCPGTPSTWRAREGVFSYSSVHAALSADEDVAPQPLPTRDTAAEGAPSADDPDRATNLGSAFHELAQAMVECGGEVGEGRVAAQVRRWNLSERAERRLRAALSRWAGSSVRAEALSHDVVRAEVPFFRRVESPYGDYLEGAIDLLCTDVGSGHALVVDYKTGDAGLPPERVRERHAMQAEFYAGVLLGEGLSSVECAFVCVERDDPDAPGEPLVVRYGFGKK